jgi:hypothetical protein
MAAKKSSRPLQVGDRVKVLGSANWQGRIVEFRGPLGAGGLLVYRVRIPHKPRAIYIELGEDQLRPMPTPPKVGASALLTTPRMEPQAPNINVRKRKKAQ